MDFSFRPLEGLGSVIVGFYKGVDCLASLPWRRETRPIKRGTLQDAEPALDLIEPACVSRCEVKMNFGMLLQPAIVLGFVRREVVENDMNLLVLVVSDDIVDEAQEFATPAPIRVSNLDLAAQHIERSKQRRRSMSGVFVIDASNRHAIREPQVTLGPFQGLNRRFLIYRDYDCVLRRIQIKPDDVCRLASKFRIGADAPGSGPLELDLVLAQDTPNLMSGNVSKRFGHQPTIPLAVASRRRLIQSLQNPAHGVLRVIRLRARARRVLQTGKPQPRESQSPLAHRTRSFAEFLRYSRRRRSGCSGEYHSRSLRSPVLDFRTTRPGFEFFSFIGCQDDFSGFSHAAKYIMKHCN